MKELASLMSFDTVKKLVSDIKNFGEKLKLIRICGQGEPLINKNLGKYLKYLRENDVTEKIELITNGSLLGRRNIIQDISKYVTRVVISVEALDGEGYQELVGSDVKFEEVVNNVKKMYDNRGDCVVHVKIPSVSVEKQEEKDIFFKTFESISDEINIEHIVPLWPEMDFSEKLVPLKGKKSRWDKDLNSRQVCVQIFKGMQVCANGDVVPCCVDWERVNLLGNINTTPLDQIWLGHQLKDLQNEHLCGNKEKIRPCAGCTMNDYSEPDNIDCLLNKLQIK
jgi:radical SAM protein with 4Fe4S-binding SPASM domain